MRPATLCLCAFLVTAACAGPIVRPADLPPPAAAPLARPLPVTLAIEPVPQAMHEELRTLAAPLGPLDERRLAPAAPLADARAPGEERLVLRPKFERTHFATDAGDRNALIIYESAIIVGLPVALISAVAWQWYGETNVQGSLETLRCGGIPREVVESFRLRSEGRGFVRGGTIRQRQEPAAVRGLTRELFDAWLRADQQGGQGS